VQVSRVDLDGRRIDFRLVREGEELLARAMKDKGEPAGERRRERSERSPGKAGASLRRAPKSPIQELKANVKKAAAKGKGRNKTGRKK
jgi:ribonuclease R